VVATAPQTGPGAIKGALIRAFLVWYQGRHGRERMAELIQRVPMPHRAALSLERDGLGVLVNGWYPAPMVHAVLDTMEQLHGSAEMPALLREGCEHATAALLRGVYMLLFRMVGTPQMYSRNIQRAWLKLHSSGERELKLLGPDTAESFIRNWPDHHRWTCLVAHETLRFAFRTMGYKQAEVEVHECVSRGHAHCRATLSFRKG